MYPCIKWHALINSAQNWIDCTWGCYLRKKLGMELFRFCLWKVRILFKIKANRNAIFQWKESSFNHIVEDHSQMYFVYFFFTSHKTAAKSGYCLLHIVPFFFFVQRITFIIFFRSCSKHFAQFCTCKTKVQYIQSKEAWLEKIFNFMLDLLNGNVLRVLKMFAMFVFLSVAQRLLGMCYGVEGKHQNLTIYINNRVSIYSR